MTDKTAQQPAGSGGKSAPQPPVDGGQQQQATGGKSAPQQQVGGMDVGAYGQQYAPQGAWQAPGSPEGTMAGAAPFLGTAGAWQPRVDTQGAWQGSVSPTLGGGSGVPGAGQGIQSDISNASLGAMPAADAAERQRIEGALFDRMKPQHQQSQAALEGQLANMGLTRGSEAWNRELQRLGDQQSRERFNALEMGGQEMQRLHGMGMANRQQGWNETLGMGQFHNAAQNQGFGQQLGSAQLASQNANLGFQQQLAAQQLQGQQHNQNFMQNLAAAQLQGQGYQQNFMQNLQNAQFQQGLYGQDFQQQMQAAQYANQLRQQQIAEQAMQRNMPLNELNALLNGQQVGMPQFPNFTPSQSTGGTNYLGAATGQYNGAMNQYNAGQMQNQGLMSGIGGIASAGIMAL